MSLIYFVELVYSNTDYVEILGKFDSLNNSYKYIENYSTHFRFNLIMEYAHLSEDQHKGSIVSVNNIKKPSKFIYIRSELNRRRKLTM
jgi:hypothetical protein